VLLDALLTAGLAVTAVRALARTSFADLVLLAGTALGLDSHLNLDVGVFNWRQFADSLGVARQLKHELTVIEDQNAAVLVGMAANLIPAKIELTICTFDDTRKNLDAAIDLRCTAVAGVGFAAALRDGSDRDANLLLLDVANQHSGVASGNLDDAVEVVGSALASGLRAGLRRARGRRRARTGRAGRRGLRALVATATTVATAVDQVAGLGRTTESVGVGGATAATAAAGSAVRAAARSTAGTTVRVVIAIKKLEVDLVVIHVLGSRGLPLDVQRKEIVAFAANFARGMGTIATDLVGVLIVVRYILAQQKLLDHVVATTTTPGTARVGHSTQECQNQKDHDDDNNNSQNSRHLDFYCPS